MQVLATLIVNKIRGIVDCCFLVNKGMRGGALFCYFFDAVLKSHNFFLLFSGHVFLIAFPLNRLSIMLLLDSNLACQSVRCGSSTRLR